MKTIWIGPIPHDPCPGHPLIRTFRTTAELLAALREGSRPDYLGLWLAYTCIPDELWRSDIPIIGLAADWNLLWHGYRHVLPLCDQVWTDTAGVEVMARAGFDHARPANLFGVPDDYLRPIEPTPERDVDMLFIGNLHPAVQRHRMSSLGRLARLSARWKVRIATNIRGDEYRRQLACAKVVFNQSIRGEWNLRVGEALSSGALLVQEAGNRELSQHLREGEHFVTWTERSLESVIEKYLTDDEERARIAAAGQIAIRDWTFAKCVERAQMEHTPFLPSRRTPRDFITVQGRAWAHLSAERPESPPVLPAGVTVESESLRGVLARMALPPETRPKSNRSRKSRPPAIDLRRSPLAPLSLFLIHSPFSAFGA